jgi:hypothetical protein
MFRDVIITATANGWIARVGCQTFVYTEPAVLLEDLRQYLENPVAKSEEMLKTSRNVRYTMSTGPATPLQTADRVYPQYAEQIPCNPYNPPNVTGTGGGVYLGETSACPPPGVRF